jgi:hypothetical protein
VYSNDGATALSITTISITTLRIEVLHVTLSISVTQHKQRSAIKLRVIHHYAECRYAKCRYDECRGVLTITVSTKVLSNTIFSLFVDQGEV